MNNKLSENNNFSTQENQEIFYNAGEKQISYRTAHTYW